MSFLAPLFLLGTLAVALPVLFHLIRRSTRDRVPFSSLLFLRPSPPRLTRRSRLENLLLLLLRCLVLCLLAFGFARPFLPAPDQIQPTEASGKEVVFLVDRSASMQRDNLWPDALARAASWLETTRPNDRVAVLAFDRRVFPVVSFEAWSSIPVPERVPMARQRLQALEPGWSATHLDQALLAGLESLEERAALELRVGPRQIVVITDSQKGSQLQGLQEREWPKDIPVILETVLARRPGNAGLQLLAQPAQKPGQETNQQVRVINTDTSAQHQFQIHWVTRQNQRLDQPSLEVYVPPGQSRVFSLPFPTNPPPLSHLSLTGDAEAFDNRAYLMPLQQDTQHLLFLGPDDRADPAGLLYYLDHAFQETAQQKIVITTHAPGSPWALTNADQAPLIVLTGNPGKEALSFTRQSVRQGNTALFVLGTAADAASLSDLLESGPLSAEEATANPYAMFGQIDFTHPWLTPFADTRYNDFTKIHFWKYRRLDTNGWPAARIVAHYDNGDPAWLHLSVGPGNVFVCTSGWQPSDSQLALSSKFVPLLYSLLEYSGGLSQRQNQYLVDDVVPVPNLANTPVLGIQPPAGVSIPAKPGEPFSHTDQPGLYTLASDASRVLFAVNLAGEESQTTPLPFEQLEQLGLPLRIGVENSVQPVRTAGRREQAAEAEGRQKLWRVLILAALLLLLGETWLAGRLTRPNASPDHALEESRFGDTPRQAQG